MLVFGPLQFQSESANILIYNYAPRSWFSMMARRDKSPGDEVTQSASASWNLPPRGEFMDCGVASQGGRPWSLVCRASIAHFATPFSALLYRRRFSPPNTRLKTLDEINKFHILLAILTFIFFNVSKMFRKFYQYLVQKFIKSLLILKSDKLSFNAVCSMGRIKFQFTL